MKLPQIISENLSESTLEATLELYVAPEIIYFSGHFPNAPILPGVVQLDWALHFANSYLGIDKENFIHIEQMKFSQVIPPNTKLYLCLTLEQNALLFKFYDEQFTYSLGKLKKVKK